MHFFRWKKDKIYDNLESMISKEFEIQDTKDDLMSVKTYRLEKE